MARDAARFGDKQLCPQSTGGKPHRFGRIISGHPLVLVCKKPAAAKFDFVGCGCILNFIAEGREDVLIGGQAAARTWDATLYDGVIKYGCSSVQIGGSDFDPIAAAIARIAASPYGQTEEGKKTLAKLRALHAAGKVSVLPPEGDKLGSTHPETDAIRVHAKSTDVEQVANELVHEGTHATNNERKRNGEVIDSMTEEKSAWDAQDNFYGDQKTQGTIPHTDTAEKMNAYRRARRDKEGFLRDHYKHQKDYFE